MRLLRFRIWHEATEEIEAHMDYNPKISKAVTTTIHESKNIMTLDLTHYASFRLNDALLPREGSILMQSTGLFDKNGKEIFEGDILESGEVVRWNGWAFVPFYPCTCGCCKHDKAYSDGRTEQTIIGNVYANPDLLK